MHESEGKLVADVVKTEDDDIKLAELEVTAGSFAAIAPVLQTFLKVI